MTDFLWKAPGSLTAYLSTTLNSLADGTSDVGAAINNSSSRNTYMDLELVLAAIDISAQTNPHVNIFILESVDGGTNYDQGDDATSNDDLQPRGDKLLCSMAIRPGTGSEAKYAIKTGLVVPPGHFKLCVVSELGAAMAASGNTLKYRLYNLADA